MVISRVRREQVKKSLRYSVLDGSAFSVMQGFTENYIIPFALALKATTYQVSLLSSIPCLAMSLIQLAAPKLTEKAGSRKGLILPAVFLQAILWLPILLIPFLFPGNKIWWLIGLFTINVVSGSLGNPAWGSMMADLVPEEKRGKYFGFRGRICTLIALVFFFIGGVVLNFSTTNIFLGFAVLFGTAIVFRLISWYFLSRMYEPPLPQKKEGLELKVLLKSIGSTNTGRFIIFIASICFATGISNPFFAVYMLRDLQFNYITFVIVSGMATLSTLLFLPFWGRRADTAGNIKVLRFTALIIPIVPVLWLGSHHIYYLIPVQILSGFGWAGFNLVASNFLYDASEGTKRTYIIALANAMNGVAGCVGALVGGLLISRLPAIFGYHALTIFTLSGILRGIIVLLMIRSFIEVRRVPQVHTMELLFGRNHQDIINRPMSMRIAPPIGRRKLSVTQSTAIKRDIINERSSISLR